jgi:WD40 repeat protein
VRAVAFHPNGRTLASGSGGERVMIWDTKEGRLTATVAQQYSGDRCLAFSPSGRTLASGAGSDGIVLTDMITGLSRLIATDTMVSAVTFSPDGSQITTGHAGGMIKTWDVASGTPVQTLSGHANAVLGVAFSPDGRTLASAGEDRTVRVWDTGTGQELLCLTDCKARVNAVAFSPDGHTLAAADHTGAVTLWRAQPPR